MAKTGDELQKYQAEADQMLGNIKRLVEDETKILSRLGIDQSEIGNILTDTFDGFTFANARNADIRPAGIRTLQHRLADATKLICSASRGPILHTIDFLTSKKRRGDDWRCSAWRR